MASRRGAEELILAGRVRVNGRRVTELGVKADPHKDRVEVDGKRLVGEKPVYYILHKPKGVVSTVRDPEGRKTVLDLMKRVPERLFPVGRLDFHTSGALLLTNDGRFSDALLRPRAGVPKTYAAKLNGHLDEDDLQALRNGVVLDDGTKTKPADVFVLREEDRNTWCQFTLTEGKNRQIHRMVEAIGHRVMRLARTEFAGIRTEGLRPGQYRPLNAKELTKLKKKYLTGEAGEGRAKSQARKRAEDKVVRQKRTAAVSGKKAPAKPKGSAKKPAPKRGGATPTRKPRRRR